MCGKLSLLRGSQRLSDALICSYQIAPFSASWLVLKREQYSVNAPKLLELWKDQAQDARKREGVGVSKGGESKLGGDQGIFRHGTLSGEVAQAAPARYSAGSTATAASNRTHRQRRCFCAPFAYLASKPTFRLVPLEPARVKSAPGPPSHLALWGNKQAAF